MKWLATEDLSKDRDVYAFEQTSRDAKREEYEDERSHRPMESRERHHGYQGSLSDGRLGHQILEV